MVVTPLFWIEVLLCTIITVSFSLVGLGVFIMGLFVPGVKVFLVLIVVIFVPSFVGGSPPPPSLGLRLLDGLSEEFLRPSQPLVLLLREFWERRSSSAASAKASSMLFDVF
jgi:hypothetical protein